MAVVGTSLRELVASQERPVDTEGIKAVLRDADDRVAAYEAVTTAAALITPLEDTRARSASLTDRAHQIAKLKSLQTSAVHTMVAAREAFVPHDRRENTTGVQTDTAYLNSLFAQLEILEHFKSGGQIDDTSESAWINPLLHLNESPIRTLSRLIFDSGLDLTRAKEAAEKLHLDLTHVIVRSTCAPLEIKAPGKFPARVATTEPGAMMTNMSAKPLNLGPDPWDTPLTANACTITHDILQGLCTVLMQFQSTGQYVFRATPILARTPCVLPLPWPPWLAVLADSQSPCCWPGICRLI
jgi:hypothetical protein